jgi:integrase
MLACVSKGTINRELACLKRMFTLAIKWGEASINPVKDVDFLEEPPGRTPYLSEDEAHRLLESSNKYLRPIILTALNTGMRTSEIMDLRWHQVHIDKVIESYLEIKKTKNNKPRAIPLNSDMVVLLKSLEGNNSSFVFAGRKGKPTTTIRKGFQTSLKRVGIEDFRLHDLRHTFASHIIMQAGDLLTLKEILGHSSLKMVRRYAHSAASHKTRQVNNLSGVFTNCHLFATREKPPL